MKLKKANVKSNGKRSFQTSEFTLTEILVVCAIIGILAGIFLSAYRAIMDKNLKNQTISVIKQVEMGLEQYKQQTGFYPPSPNGGSLIFRHDHKNPTNPTTNDITLINCFPSFQNWKEEGMIDMTRYGSPELRDAFGNPFWYRCPGYHNRSSFDLESSGPDDDFGYSDSDKHSVINKPRLQKDNIANWE